MYNLIQRDISTLRQTLLGGLRLRLHLRFPLLQVSIGHCPLQRHANLKTQRRARVIRMQKSTGGVRRGSGIHTSSRTNLFGNRSIITSLPHSMRKVPSDILWLGGFNSEIVNSSRNPSILIRTRPITLIFLVTPNLKPRNRWRELEIGKFTIARTDDFIFGERLSSR
jgi:hypothetical protein